jgi:LysM repeat protein
MTKEAKVGMLTGLGVIVLIGVLLSEYLGTPGSGPGGAAPASLATGHMAALPMGQNKREEILQPVGVPSMARSDAPEGSSGMALNTLPTAFAADTPKPADAAPAPTAAGPVVSAPVSVVPAGPVQVASIADNNNVPPTIQLDAAALPPAAAPSDATAAAAAPKPAAKSAPVKVAGEEYVIARGDTLDKISRKFYKSASSESKNRITAANPSLLKDGQPYLIAGRKIVIPAASAAVAQAPAAAAPKAEAKKTNDPGVVIRQPGVAHGQEKAASDAPKTEAAKSADAARKTDAKVYVVKEGDSLEKIAKQLNSANYRDEIKKIMAANNIKDPGALQIGERLKLPM